MQPLNSVLYHDHQLQLLKWEARKFVKEVEMTRHRNNDIIQVSIFFFRRNSHPSLKYLFDPMNFDVALNIYLLPS